MTTRWIALAVFVCTTVGLSTIFLDTHWVTDVLGGRVDVLSDAATSTIPRVRSGQMRALAVSSAERYPSGSAPETAGGSAPGNTAPCRCGT